MRITVSFDEYLFFLYLKNFRKKYLLPEIIQCICASLSKLFFYMCFTHNFYNLTYK